MSSHGPVIQALPPDVATKIKSSTSITHLHGVVVDLVKNSLDAGARTLLVSVDFKRGSCIVEDDGEGIRPAEFEPTGGLGKAHRVSSSPVLGCRALLIICQIPPSIGFQLPMDIVVYS
jgi:DNA mismatch repair protein MLH3